MALPEVYAGERIAKKIARAGLCAKREAERWITAGRVRVNGVVITSPALNVVESDVVEVDGKPLPTSAAPARLFLFHKPVGVVCTARDPQGRRTIFDMLPPKPHLTSVGRLDLNSEGLLLLTTDSKLATTLMHPRTELPRTYRVRIFGTPHEQDLQRLRQGVEIEGIRYRPVQIELEKTTLENKNQWCRMTLFEGKNREIRKLFESMEIQVNRLIRVGYGPFELADLPSGGLKEVAPAVLQRFISTLPHGT